MGNGNASGLTADRNVRAPVWRETRLGTIARFVKEDGIAALV